MRYVQVLAADGRRCDISLYGITPPQNVTCCGAEEKRRSPGTGTGTPPLFARPGRFTRPAGLLGRAHPQRQSMVAFQTSGCRIVCGVSLNDQSVSAPSTERVDNGQSLLLRRHSTGRPDFQSGAAR